MKRVEFRLSMPCCASWNGKWSGEDRNYTIVKKLSEKMLSFLGICEEEDVSWWYRWDDGWAAEVTARHLRKGERAKKSDGFCGYDWMVDSILRHNEIRAS